MILILYSTVTVPAILAFDVVDTRGGLEAIEWMVDALFMTDILLTFRTGIFLSDLESTAPNGMSINWDRRTIALTYLRSWFLIDFFASFPLDRMLGSEELALLPVLKAVRIVRLIRLVRLIKLSRFVKQLEEEGILSPIFLRLSSLLFMLVFIAHLLACAWFAVGAYLQGDAALSWVRNYQIQYAEYNWSAAGLDESDPDLAALRDKMSVMSVENQTTVGAAMRTYSVPLIEETRTLQRWLSSFYWAVTTMSTVGYGDIFPVNDQERFFVLFAELFGVFFFGYITSSIRHLTKVSNRKEMNIDQNLEMVQSYLINRRVPYVMRRQVRHSFEYYYARKRMVAMPSLLDELSTALNHELTCHEYADYIETFPTLRKQSHDFLAVFCPKLEPFYSTAGEYILFTGVVSTEMYFICHGVVGLFTSDESKKLCTLCDGGCFGLRALRTSTYCAGYTAKALSPCHMLYLTKGAFEQVAASFPDSYDCIAEMLGADYREALRRDGAFGSSTPGSTPPRSRASSADPGRRPEPAVTDSMKSSPPMTSSRGHSATPHQPSQLDLNAHRSVACPPPTRPTSPAGSGCYSILAAAGADPYAAPSAKPAAESPSPSPPPSPSPAGTSTSANLASTPQMPQRQHSGSRLTRSPKVLRTLSGSIETMITSQLERRGLISRMPYLKKHRGCTSGPHADHSAAVSEMRISEMRLDVGPMMNTTRAYQSHLLREMAGAGKVRRRHSVHEFLEKNGNPNAILGSDGPTVENTCFIPPSATWKVRWDMVVGLLTIYSCSALPYRFAFQDHATCSVLESTGEVDGAKCAWFIVDTFIDFAFLSDIIITFFTAFNTPDGELEADLHAIAARYLCGFFTVDLLSSFPVNLVFYLADTKTTGSSQALNLLRLIRLVRLLRLLRLLKVRHYFRKVQTELGLNKAAVQLLELLIYVLYALHVSGCLWYLTISLDVLYTPLPISGGTHQLSWASITAYLDLDCKQMGYCYPHADTAPRYLVSAYWAFTTLSTIGFGDVKANTDIEKLLACLVMLIGPIMLGYIVSRITDLVGSIDIKGSRRRGRMAALKMSLADAQLPKELTSRMVNYYSNFLSEGSDYTAEQAMLLRLPPPFKLELILFLSKEIILNISLFHDQEPAFIVSVCKTLTPVFAAPGDYLFHEGSVGSEMYFLHSGTAEMVLEAGETRSERIIQRLEAVCHFGEVALLLEGERREASVRAVTFCCLFSYSRTQLNAMLDLFPNAKTMLTELANKTLGKIKPKQRLRRAFRMAITVNKLCGGFNRNSSSPAPAVASPGKADGGENEEAAPARPARHDHRSSRSLISEALASTDEYDTFLETTASPNLLSREIHVEDTLAC